MNNIPVKASAPGKVILLGEHTVVYGQPAIALPVSKLRAEVTISLSQNPEGEIWIDSPTAHMYKNISALPPAHPLRKVVELTLSVCKPTAIPGIMIHISSSLPIAGGMGSGAAVSCAIVRALSTFLQNEPLDKETTNRLVYEIEKIHHKNPSGIDNTVITFERPVFFQKDKKIDFIEPTKPLDFLIADTGIGSKTALMIEGVRKRFAKNTVHYEMVLGEIGKLVGKAKIALQKGDDVSLADAMNNNHSLLQELEVSCYSLDRLVKAARESGAKAAKLTGAGGGGSMLALVSNESRETVKKALLLAGAVRVFPFTLNPEDE